MVEALFRHIPRSLDGILYPVDRALRMSCYPAVLAAQNLLVRLTSMDGATRTGRANLLVAGPDPWAHELPHRIFVSPPKQRRLETIPGWQLHSRLQKMEQDFDLVFARVDKIAERMFFPSTYLRVPEWVDTGLPLPDDPTSLLRASESLARDIRVAQRNGLETSVSGLLDDFQEFYHSMYVPFIHARHGAVARPRNEISFRNCFRRGGLIWLTRGGERLAGLVFEVTRDGLSIRGHATRDGYAGLTKRGAASALYFHAIRHARERGCRFLDFGGCAGCLTDGVLHYKRKWGVQVRIRPTNQFYTLVRWAAWNTAVAAFLTELPLVHQSGNRLTAIAAMHFEGAAGQAETDKIYGTLHVPGLDEFAIVNTCGWETNIVPPPATLLIGGSPTIDKVLNCHLSRDREKHAQTH